jgi:hypothetical protein
MTTWWCPLLHRCKILVFLVLTTLANPAAADITSKQSLSDQQRYHAIMAEENARVSQRNFIRRMAGGGAGLIIGLTGYYRGKGGLLAKGIYSVAQTASVITIGDAVADYNSPSLILSLNQLTENSALISREQLQRMVATHQTQEVRTSYLKSGYSALILSGLYGLNSAYEFRQQNSTISRIYAFLSANCLLLSGGAFYRAYQGTAGQSETISFEISPLGSLTLNF